MWMSGMEMQQAMTDFLGRTGKTQRALEFFLYAMAFSAISFGLFALVSMVRGL